MINLRLLVENAIIYKNNIVFESLIFVRTLILVAKYLIISDHLLIGHRQVYLTDPLPSDRKYVGNSTVTSQPSSLD